MGSRLLRPQSRRSRHDRQGPQSLPEIVSLFAGAAADAVRIQSRRTGQQERLPCDGQVWFCGGHRSGGLGRRRSARLRKLQRRQSGDRGRKEGWMPRLAPAGGLLPGARLLRSTATAATTPGPAIANTERRSRRIGPASACPERVLGGGPGRRRRRPHARHATHVPRRPCSRRRQFLFPPPPLRPLRRRRPTKPPGTHTTPGCASDLPIVEFSGNSGPP